MYLKMSSEISFNLDQSKNLWFGKELNDECPAPSTALYQETDPYYRVLTCSDLFWPTH